MSTIPGIVSKEDMIKSIINIKNFVDKEGKISRESVFKILIRTFIKDTADHDSDPNYDACELFLKDYVDGIEFIEDLLYKDIDKEFTISKVDEEVEEFAAALEGFDYTYINSCGTAEDKLNPYKRLAMSEFCDVIITLSAALTHVGDDNAWTTMFSSILKFINLVVDNIEKLHSNSILRAMKKKMNSLMISIVAVEELTDEFDLKRSPMLKSYLLYDSYGKLEFSWGYPTYEGVLDSVIYSIKSLYDIEALKKYSKLELVKIARRHYDIISLSFDYIDLGSLYNFEALD